MTKQEVKQGVIRVINEMHDIDDEIRTYHNLEKVLGLDSLDKIETIIALENEFAITIGDEFVDDIHTVGDLILIVERLVIVEVTTIID